MWSVRSVIFYRLISLLCTTLGLFAALIFYFSSDMLQEFSHKDSQRLAQFVAQNIEMQLDKSYAFLNDLAASFGRAGTPPEAWNLGQYVGYHASIFSTLYAYDSNAQLVTGYKRDFPNKPVDTLRLQRPLQNNLDVVLHRVIKTGQPELSDFLTDGEGEIFQVYLAPVFSSDMSVRYVISGAIFPNRNSFNEIAAGLPLGKDNFVALLNQNGEPIVTDGPDYLLKHPQVFRAAAEFADNPKRVLEWNADNVSHAYSVHSSDMKKYKLRFLYGVESSLLKEKSKHTTRILIVVLVVTFLFSLVVSFLVGSRVVTPIRLIARKVENINQGAFDSQTKYAKKDEFLHILTRLDEIAAKIAKGKLLGDLWSREKGIGKLNNRTDTE